VQDEPARQTSRLHLIVCGRVQGVGFRAFVMEQFHAHRLHGWVRNVGYDQVEVVAEGPRTDLERFSTAVIQGPRAARVESSTVEWERASGEFTRAEVR
jgi:acylphosphatase